MDILIGIGIGAAIVVPVFVAICVGCTIKTKCCKNSKQDSTDTQNNVEAGVEIFTGSPDRQLIEEDIDGDDLSITLQNVLDDDVWIDDMTGVMNHCIPILKGCHDLTSKLVPVTAKACDSDEDNKKIAEMALEVQPRLDEVVQMLEGPLDPRLLEARCTALYFAVSNLCLIIKSICKDAEDISAWIDGSLRETEGHLKNLQAEAQALYRRPSLSGSINGRGGMDTSPIAGLSLTGTHSNSSTASSSHTDSAESGIDLQTPSERGSEHTPHSPSQTNKIVDDTSKLHHGSTIVEVHVGDASPHPVEVIEMKSFSNQAYTVTAE